MLDTFNAATFSSSGYINGNGKVDYLVFRLFFFGLVLATIETNAAVPSFNWEMQTARLQRILCEETGYGIPRRKDTNEASPAASSSKESKESKDSKESKGAKGAKGAKDK